MRDTIKEFAEKMDCYIDKHHYSNDWETMAIQIHVGAVLNDVGRIHQALVNHMTNADYIDGAELADRAMEIATDAMMVWSLLHPSTQHNRNGNPVKRLPKMDENEVVYTITQDDTIDGWFFIREKDTRIPIDYVWTLDAAVQFCNDMGWKYEIV